MDAGEHRNGDPERAPRRASLGRKVAIGCLMTWLGFVSGAMVAALLSRIAATMMRGPECDGIPSCNWYVWAGIGGLVGAVTLPVLVLWVLGRPAKGGGSNPDRGF